MYYSSSLHAIFPDGFVLLDAGGGILPLPLCGESLQHHRKDAHVSRHVLGYFHFTCFELFDFMIT